MIVKSLRDNVIGVGVGIGLLTATWFSVAGAALLANKGWNENVAGGAPAIPLPLVTFALIIAAVLAMAARQTRRALIMCLIANILPFAITYGVLRAWGVDAR